jgi:anti-sigma regulatory factor (Ser/Thr protein kinase)
MSEKHLTFKLKNRLADLEKINGAIEKLHRELGFSKRCKCETNLVLEELFTNIINHGHRDSGDHEVLVRFRIEPDELRIEIEDDGVPFDPLTAEPPCLDADIEKRDVGGLGVFLARKFADKVSYERVGEKNIVTIIKRLHNENGSDECPPVAHLG